MVDKKNIFVTLNIITKIKCSLVSANIVWFFFQIIMCTTLHFSLWRLSNYILKEISQCNFIYLCPYLPHSLPTVSDQLHSYCTFKKFIRDRVSMKCCLHKANKSEVGRMLQLPPFIICGLSSWLCLGHTILINIAK